MNVKTILALTLATVACHKIAPSSQVSMKTTGQGDCQLNAQLIEPLNDDCLLNIISRNPIKDVLNVLPPTNRALQEAVRKKVQGHWPDWFLKKIKDEGGSTNAGRNLVLYYLAFLKLPHIFSEDPKGAKKYLQFTKVPMPQNYKNPTEWSNNNRYIGVVGEHAIAFADIFDGNDGGVDVYVYDTKKKEIVFTGSGLRGVNLDHTDSELDIHIFEPIGPRTFIMALEYRGERSSSLSLWDWSKPKAEEPVWTQKVSKLMVYNNLPTLLRVDDNQFVTLKWHDYGSYVDPYLWTAADTGGRTFTEKRIDRIISKYCGQYKLNGDRTEKRVDLLQLQQKLKSKKVPVTVSSPTLSIVHGGSGIPLTARTRLKITKEGNVVYSAGQEIHHLFPNKLGKHGLISFLTPYGDIVLKADSENPIRYINFWNIVDAYAKDLITKFGGKAPR